MSSGDVAWDEKRDEKVPTSPTLCERNNTGLTIDLESGKPVRTREELIELSCRSQLMFFSNMDQQVWFRKSAKRHEKGI